MHAARANRSTAWGMPQKAEVADTEWVFVAHQLPESLRGRVVVFVDGHVEE
jgi:prepilin-type processing-associated H-X9-DG protein